MEIDLQPIFMAQTVTEEKLRDKKKESVRLEQSRGLTELLKDLLNALH
jgi:hypothetical protein